MVEKQLVMKLAMRIKEIDRNYEMNNNADLDNGVFNKFAQAAEKKAHEVNNNSRILCSKSSGNLTAEKVE